MRFAILIAAFGIMTGAPALVPSLAPAAYAQAATLTLEERALQAQIVALANAGDTAGLNSLIARQTTLGNAASLAKVAKAIAANGASLASSNPTGAAALVNAAILIASDTSVAAADDTVGAAVGASASLASVIMGRSSDTDAAAAAARISVVTAAKSSSNTNVGLSFYQNGDSATKRAYDGVVVQGNSQQQGGQQQNRIVRRAPLRPTGSDVPAVIEPNPAQSGSPT